MTGKAPEAGFIVCDRMNDTGCLAVEKRRVSSAIEVGEEGCRKMRRTEGAR